MSKLSNDDDNLIMGRRLMAIRVSSGLTQADFADKLSLSLRAYANYERGEREMPTALFKSLVDTFRIDPLWQLTGPGEDPVQFGKRVLDMDLMEGVIRLIEEWLVKHRRTLKPEKKARVIRLGYEHCVAKGGIDTTHLREMLSVAA
ncbi:helix-turn-helix transcriptional regulator [Sinimarinibacterium sp. CAU 1509]|uniref:helix-turn-helix domain-containing protein n=1 Tax=Sinimarinibacterium sp. CAU 1509 TaxID=2562283 RepID=UPI0010AC4F22|nr:helix-turn-helix transcriptional regulator [Sinimarinibacterium sp. CAU 1509]TJY61137.1 helix-turn-helix transcriptional regulator [Sinimarinibacterium sp. CAU 1509]